MTRFLNAISGKVLPGVNRRINELETKVKELDPEKIAEKVQKTSEGWLTNTANKAVEEKTKSFSGRLDKLEKDFGTTNEQLAELVTKVKKLVSGTQMTVQNIRVPLQEILRVIDKLASETGEGKKG